MSAMPALDWPEDEPASWPVGYLDGSRTADAHRDGPRSTRPATRRPVTWPLVHHAVRGQAARAQAVRAQRPVPRRSVPRSGPCPGAVRAQAPRGDAAPAPLRLTRRGRIVVAAAAALLVTLLSLLATGAAAWATSHTAPYARRGPESRSGARPSRPEPLVGRGDRRPERRPPTGHAADHRPQRPVRRRDPGRPAAVGAPRLSSRLPRHAAGKACDTPAALVKTPRAPAFPDWWLVATCLRPACLLA